MYPTAYLEPILIYDSRYAVGTKSNSANEYENFYITFVLIINSKLVNTYFLSINVWHCMIAQTLYKDSGMIAEILYKVQQNATIISI